MDKTQQERRVGRVVVVNEEMVEDGGHDSLCEDGGESGDHE